MESIYGVPQHAIFPSTWQAAADETVSTFDGGSMQRLAIYLINSTPRSVVIELIAKLALPENYGGIEHKSSRL